MTELKKKIVQELILQYRKPWAKRIDAETYKFVVGHICRGDENSEALRYFMSAAGIDEIMDAVNQELIAPSYTDL